MGFFGPRNDAGALKLENDALARSDRDQNVSEPALQPPERAREEIFEIR